MVSRKSVLVAAFAATALAAPIVAVAGTASAASSGGTTFHVTKVLSKSFVAPLQIAVAAHQVFVTDAFTGVLRKTNSSHVIARGYTPGDVSGVAVDVRHHDLAYLKSHDNHALGTKFVIMHRGHQTTVLDLAAYEKKHNPDGNVHYGVVHASSCARKALKAAGVPVSYRGAVDSHPYAVAYLGGHNWAVADAGGNDILKINSATHTISVLAVLPSQPFTFTKAYVTENHGPSCAVGVKYYAEAVPTDVEVGPNGALYVSTLPGAGFPMKGRVYTISPTGALKLIGHGFNGATNLAVTPTGTVYVAELYSGDIAVLNGSTPTTVAKLPGVAAVEWAYGRMFAATAPAALAAEGGPPTKAPGEVVVLQK